jgi:hypothetical protein
MNDTPDSLIPYDEIVQEALRAVVGRVLGQVEAEGGTLPGNHHFYITFKTEAPGVSIPAHLKERFPDEMTIVLQNKFWDLTVEDDGFSVGLSFNQVPAKLVIPFSAITAFVDPAVDFGLQFQAAISEDEPEPHDDAENDSPDNDGKPSGSDDGSQGSPAAAASSCSTWPSSAPFPVKAKSSPMNRKAAARRQCAPSLRREPRFR